MFPGEVDDKYLCSLLGPEGEKMLDLEIAKVRAQVGEEKFEEYSREFFRQMAQQQSGGLFTQDVSQKQKQPKQEQTILLPTENIQQLEEEAFQTEATEGFQQHFEVHKEMIPGSTNKFKITYNNGDSYEGEIQNNEKNGWGIYFYSNGQKYDGLFVDDEISGFGKYFFLSGAVYEGDWYHGVKHGFGVLKFSNKDTYDGQFLDDQIHGKGVFKYSNGDVFEGHWTRSKKNGRGELRTIDDRVMIGEWVDDKFSQQ